MSNLIPPKIGGKVPFTCPDCGHIFSHKKPLIPLPVRCPNCGKMNCREDKHAAW